MVLIYDNVILFMIGVNIFMFLKELFEWSRTQSGGNETTEYSYFHNGCQLQCVLLLMCRHVIARAWRRSLSLSLAEHFRTLTQSDNRSIFRSIIQPIGKLAILIDTSLTRAERHGEALPN